MNPTRIFMISSLFLMSACSGGDPLDALWPAQSGNGPRIMWDLGATPLPEIPFPNDVATIPDSNSPTGLRMNATLKADTQLERDIRVNMTKLDGFGTFAPIWVRFESQDPTKPELARLDIEKIAAVQKGDAAFEDDVVFLINVSPESPTYGEAIVLDFGNGSFPLTLEEPDNYFSSDPRVEASTLLFETYEEDLDGDGFFDVFEDLNQNGVLDDGEDIDGDGKLDICEDSDSDGVFDHPNTWATVLNDAGYSDPYSDLITFYELETDTLWFRPVVPMEEATTYAVVLTTDLTGKNGEPILSPFAAAHHLEQTKALRPLIDDKLLEKYGSSADEVAFAWSFTTQSTTRELVALREGLHGVGKFSYLKNAYPPEVTNLAITSDDEGLDGYLLSPAKIKLLLDVVFDSLGVGGYSTDRINNLVDTYGAVDYMVAGDFTSPNFLNEEDNPGTGVFNIDANTGAAIHAGESIRFLLVVPKAEYGTAPFPTALYCHGYTSMKLEALAFAGILAKFGIATYVIDAVGHGLPLGGDEYTPIIEDLLSVLDDQGLGPLYPAIAADRARDLNNDGIYEVGGDFWTNNLFHTRDVVRQTVIDYMQSARVLRAFDGEALWDLDLNFDGVKNDIAGDFNNDGVPDVGGPDAAFQVMGTSMGGIVSSIIGAVEPMVDSAAPISSGGGLLEVGLRTTLGGVRRAVILPILGPMIIGKPKGADNRIMNLIWLVNDVFSEQEVPFASVGKISGDDVIDELRPGDTLTLENLTNGHVDSVVVAADRSFRAHTPADKGDLVRVTLSRPDGTVYKTIDTFEYPVEAFQGEAFDYGDPLFAIQGGFGYRRNTPDMRRLISLAQIILEPADPVNFGRHYADPLHVRPEEPRRANALFTITLGDSTVPISTGISLARSTGVIGYKEPDPLYGVSQNQLLIDMHVTEAVEKLYYFADDACHYDSRNLNFDIDDLSNGLHEDDLPRLAEINLAPFCDGTALAPAECDLCEEKPPLRATVTDDHGVRAARFVALNPRGQHAIDLPDPDAPFDTSTFVLNQIGLFLKTSGKVLSDHPCLAADNCTDCPNNDDCPTGVPDATTL